MSPLIWCHKCQWYIFGGWCPSLSCLCFRWGQQALSSGSWPACSWSCFKAGRSLPSPGGPSPSFCVWCSSSLPLGCCHGSTILPTSVASSLASSCPSPSYPTSVLAAWTFTANAARSLFFCWCSWDSFQALWCSSMSTQSSVNGASCSPASPSRTNSARSTTSTLNSIDVWTVWAQQEGVRSKDVDCQPVSPLCLRLTWGLFSFSVKNDNILVCFLLCLYECLCHLS